MLKYLDKVKVIAETASNGQECTEMVCSKEPGYYSLIIVSACPAPGFDKICMVAHNSCTTVRYPNACQERLWYLSGCSCLGTEEPLSSNSNHGSVCQCDDRPDWRRCSCRVQRLRHKTYQAQRAWEDDDGTAWSQSTSAFASGSSQGRQWEPRRIKRAKVSVLFRSFSVIKKITVACIIDNNCFHSTEYLVAFGATHWGIWFVLLSCLGHECSIILSFYMVASLHITLTFLSSFLFSITYLWPGVRIGEKAIGREGAFGCLFIIILCFCLSIWFMTWLLLLSAYLWLLRISALHLHSALLFSFFFSKVWLIPFLHYGAGISGLHCSFFFWTFDFPVWRQFSDFLSKFFFFLPAQALLLFHFIFFDMIVWLFFFFFNSPDTSLMSTTFLFLFNFWNCICR